MYIFFRICTHRAVPFTGGDWKNGSSRDKKAVRPQGPDCFFVEIHGLLLLVHHIVLTADAFDMDCFEHRAHELLAQAHTTREREYSAAYILPTVALQDGHIVGLLYEADLLAGLHALTQQFEQFGVDLVDLLAAEVQLARVFGVGRRFGAPHDVVYHGDAVLWRKLLRGVAPCLVGVDVALDDEAVVTEVGRLLRDSVEQRAAAAYVRRVAYHHHLGEAAAHLEDHVPHGRVAVFAAAEVRESAVYEAYVLGRHALIDEAVHGAGPEVDVGHHRVLYQHYGLLVAVQALGYLLYGKWRYRCARAYPQDVDAVAQGALHMRVVGHLDGYGQPRFGLHLVEPFEPGLAYAFEGAGLRAGLPHSGAYYVHTSRAGQLQGRLDGLFAGFGTARPRYDEGPFGPEYEFSHLNEFWWLFKDLPYLVGPMHRFDEPVAVVALDHAPQYLQLVYVLAQYVQHIVLVAQKYRGPCLRQALG